MSGDYQEKTGKKNIPASLRAHFRLLFNNFTGTESERTFLLSSVIVALGGRLLDSDTGGAMCGDAEMIRKRHRRDGKKERRVPYR